MYYRPDFLNIGRSLTGILILFLSISLLSCSDADIDEPFDASGSAYEPIIMERGNLETSIDFIDNRALESTGKIYSYGKYILINEKYEGVHVFDNADPRNPLKIGFIKIPGCIDMAVKEGILYVDNAVDLVAIDINNLPEISLEKRIVGIFPELAAPDLGYVPYQYIKENRPDNTVIVKWVLK